jgi:hypothetical protein
LKIAGTNLARLTSVSFLVSLSTASKPSNLYPILSMQNVTTWVWTAVLMFMNLKMRRILAMYSFNLSIFASLKAKVWKTFLSVLHLRAYPYPVLQSKHDSETSALTKNIDIN